jgi:hypothetical protein
MSASNRTISAPRTTNAVVVVVDDGPDDPDENGSPTSMSMSLNEDDGIGMFDGADAGASAGAGEDMLF